MNALNATSPVALIAARFNELNKSEIAIQTLAKRGKVKLLAAIEAMEAKAAAEAKAAKKKEPKTKGGNKGPRENTLKQAAEALLVKTDENGMGLSYLSILGELAKTFTDAKTTVGCLAWYAAKLTKSGVQVPARPRANAKKVATSAE